MVWVMRARAVVIFDGRCGPCERLAGWLRRLDCFRQLTIIASTDRAGLGRLGLDWLSEERLGADLHMVMSDGQIAVGYEAYQRLVRLVVTLWPVVPMVWLGGVTGVGPRMYRRFADSRVCVVGK